MTPGGSTAGGRKSLEIEVSDFGPISSGRFTVRPVTVFVGPNGSGKTHATTLVHSVLSACQDDGAEDIVEAARGQISDPKFRAALEEMGRRLDGTAGDKAEIPARCINAVTAMVLRRLEAKLLYNILRNFGADFGDLVRIGSRSTVIKINYNVHVEIKLTRDHATVKSSFPDVKYSLKRKNGRIDIHDSLERDAIGDVKANKDGRDAALLAAEMLGVEGSQSHLVMFMLAHRIMSMITNGVPSSRYIPAGRSTLLVSYKEIAAGAMKRVGRVVKTALGTDGHTGISLDFVMDIIRLKERKTRRTPKRKDDMIMDMFGGHIVVLKGGNSAPEIMYRLKKTHMPLHRVSSGIAETAAIPIFFENYSHENSILIIDEPEAHLHPENQLKLARHIVRSAKQNNSQVILATHSAFILEQLSQLVMLSQLTDKQRVKVGNELEDYIMDKDIAPYLFRLTPSGSYTMEEIGHSEGTGIDQDEFINVTESLYDNHVRIERVLEG